MARQIRAFWLVLSWSGFCHTDRFRGNGHKLCIFLFSKAGKFKTSMIRVPYNKLLTNLASSSRTGEYWPSVVFVRTSLRSVRTATTSGQYSAVRPSRSVSQRLLLASLPWINKDYSSSSPSSQTRSPEPSLPQFRAINSLHQEDPRAEEPSPALAVNFRPKISRCPHLHLLPLQFLPMSFLQR